MEFLKYKNLYYIKYCNLRYNYLIVDFQIIENFCHYNFFFNDVEESLQLCSNGCLLSKVLHPLYYTGRVQSNKS